MRGCSVVDILHSPSKNAPITTRSAESVYVSGRQLENRQTLVCGCTPPLSFPLANNVDSCVTLQSGNRWEIIVSSSNCLLSTEGPSLVQMGAFSDLSYLALDVIRARPTVSVFSTSNVVGLPIVNVDPTSTTMVVDSVLNV